ncbi:MAG: hypothetical protein VYE68_00715 [Acidobacteriota bacterium]|nr:hypothetical protein [Acidobacteriota bacterium]
MTVPWFISRWWTTGPPRHPSDDQLLAIALGTQERNTISVARHVRVCRSCQHRAAHTSTMLGALSDAAETAFSETYPENRLTIQRARIGTRLARAIGTDAPARVIPFPFSRPQSRRLGFASGRWGVATATGLFLGVTVGQVIHFHPERAPTLSPAPTASTRSLDGGERSPAATLDLTGTIELPSVRGDSPTAPVPLTLNEFARVMGNEPFLGARDVSSTGLSIAELEPIDALTPHVQDLPNGP